MMFPFVTDLATLIAAASAAVRVRRSLWRFGFWGSPVRPATSG